MPHLSLFAASESVSARNHARHLAGALWYSQAGWLRLRETTVENERLVAGNRCNMQNLDSPVY